MRVSLIEASLFEGHNIVVPCIVGAKDCRQGGAALDREVVHGKGTGRAAGPWRSDDAIRASAKAAIRTATDGIDLIGEIIQVIPVAGWC
eukprot:COSAG06_NODE_30911_length_530_cov_0.832947_1_plen_88_part_10